MNKLYLDSDVILDLLLDREPFADSISDLIETALDRNVQLFTSPISITNIYYIIEKLENRNQALTKTKKVLELVKIEGVGQSTIDEAIKSSFIDFEDGVQNFCAAHAGHKIIITRNGKDYKTSTLSILTPGEYLAQLNAQ